MRAYIYVARDKKNIGMELETEILGILNEDDTFDNEITKSYQHEW